MAKSKKTETEELNDILFDTLGEYVNPKCWEITPRTRDGKPTGHYLVMCDEHPGCDAYLKEARYCRYQVRGENPSLFSHQVILFNKPQPPPRTRRGFLFYAGEAGIRPARSSGLQGVPGTHHRTPGKPGSRRFPGDNGRTQRRYVHGQLSA